MATSGVYTFNLSRDQIITESLTNVGVLDPEGETASPVMISSAASRLNMLIKAWQNLGLQIWERKLIYIFFQNAQNVYTLGSNGGAGGDNGSLSYVNTTATALVGSNLTVASITGINNADNIGIQLANGNLFWTTVNGSPSGTTVVLTGTPATAIATNAVVYTYTTALARPLRLLDGFVHYTVGLNDAPIRVINIEEWERFGMKTSSGQTTQVVYFPQIGNGLVKVYPVPNDVTKVLTLEALYPFQDFTASGDNPDFPQEWLMAIVWGLSYELAVQYGLTETRLGIIEKAREYWLNLAQASSQEPAAFFQPDYYNSINSDWY